jgi:error-prone DNA polymerase
LHKNELTQLAAIGALNSLERTDRRGALWESERAVRRPGELFETADEGAADSPLAVMTPEERLCADFHGTGVTVGRHPMAHRRSEFERMGLIPAAKLRFLPNGRRVRIGGSVIVRQRPGTAHGFVFVSMEDETGIMNAIVTPDLYQSVRMALVNEPYLLVEGVLQNVDNVVSVRAESVLPLRAPRTGSVSHDFH